MFNDDPQNAIKGGLSVGIPGEIKGYWEAHQRFGKLAWKQLFEPSIKLAREGWKVSKFLARRIEVSESFILNDPTWSRTFTVDGRLLREGDYISRPILAKTLEAIAEQGEQLFYNGWIAEALVKTIRENGGIATIEDFHNYTSQSELPLIGSYRGMNVITAPPPASGAVLLSILNIVENYDFSNRTALNIHRMVEAFKFSYAKRCFIGDPVDVLFVNLDDISKYITNCKENHQ
jgi:gamma-glutamyltranspeptidase/glutathione hydrolase/leukotriene-C4 hydrolase